MIPEKCKNWKVANAPMFNYWCRYICGHTNGRLCEPWCLIAEKHGLWTLWITLGLPLAIVLALIFYLA